MLQLSSHEHVVENNYKNSHHYQKSDHLPSSSENLGLGRTLFRASALYFPVNMSATAAVHSRRLRLSPLSTRTTLAQFIVIKGRKPKMRKLCRFFASSSTPDLPEPYFDAAPAPRNVSALVGKTAFLTCVVRNLGKAKSVSE